MKIIKKIFNWLFGKHWGYTPKEKEQVKYEESKLAFDDLQILAKVEPIEVESHTEQSFEPPKKVFDTTHNPNKYWRRFHKDGKDYWKKFYKQ